MWFFLMVCNPCAGAVSLQHESALGTTESHLYPLSLFDLPAMKPGAPRIQEKLGIHQDLWTDPGQT